MKIVVAMKQVPDVQAIRIRDRKPVLDDVQFTLGSIDKNALEAGIQLKESAGASLVVLSAGSEEVEDTIKEALAAGADEAFLIADDSIKNADSADVAQLLAAAISKIDDASIVIFGEGSGDNYSGQVSSRVADILNWPQVGFASSIELGPDTAKIIRSLEDSEETVECSLPVIVSVLAGINEPRIPSVTQILKAGKKPKEVVSADELGIKIPAVKKISTVSNLAPESQRKQIAVKSVEELVKALEAERMIER